MTIRTEWNTKDESVSFHKPSYVLCWLMGPYPENDRLVSSVVLHYVQPTICINANCYTSNLKYQTPIYYGMYI